MTNFSKEYQASAYAVKISFSIGARVQRAYATKKKKKYSFERDLELELVSQWDEFRMTGSRDNRIGTCQSCRFTLL